MDLSKRAGLIAAAITTISAVITGGWVAYNAFAMVHRHEKQLSAMQVDIRSLSESSIRHDETLRTLEDVKHSISAVQRTLGYVQIDVAKVCVAAHQGDASKCHTTGVRGH